MIVLVDTCVWSLALRRSEGMLHPDELRVVALLKETILEGRARLAGVVRQELLSGVRQRAQFEALLAATRAFEDVPLTTEDYEEAAICDNVCRSAGISGSTTDFLLCALAIRREWALLTIDKDFLRYATRLPLRLLPDEPGQSPSSEA